IRSNRLNIQRTLARNRHRWQQRGWFSRGVIHGSTSLRLLETNIGYCYRGMLWPSTKMSSSTVLRISVDESVLDGSSLCSLRVAFVCHLGRELHSQENGWADI